MVFNLDILEKGFRVGESVIKKMLALLGSIFRGTIIKTHLKDKQKL
jgi:hypothetical protein